MKKSLKNFKKGKYQVFCDTPEATKALFNTIDAPIVDASQDLYVAVSNDRKELIDKEAIVFEFSPRPSEFIPVEKASDLDWLNYLKKETAADQELKESAKRITRKVIDVVKRRQLEAKSIFEKLDVGFDLIRLAYVLNEASSIAEKELILEEFTLRPCKESERGMSIIHTMYEGSQDFFKELSVGNIEMTLEDLKPGDQVIREDLELLNPFFDPHEEDPMVYLGDSESKGYGAFAWRRPDNAWSLYKGKIKEVNKTLEPGHTIKKSKLFGELQPIEGNIETIRNIRSDEDVVFVGKNSKQESLFAYYNREGAHLFIASV